MSDIGSFLLIYEYINFFYLQPRRLWHTDRWFSLFGPNESLMSLCRWMARWGILRRGRGTWTSRWSSLLSTCRWRNLEHEDVWKLKGGKLNNYSLLQYLDHDPACNSEVAVKPGVPDAAAVALHAHLKASLFGSFGPRFHSQARAVRVCSHQGKTIARQVASAHRKGNDAGEVPGQEVLRGETWRGFDSERKWSRDCNSPNVAARADLCRRPDVPLLCLLELNEAGGQ